MTTARVIDSRDAKAVLSPGYNYLFRKTDGFFARWGATLDDDPQYSPIGPELADIEISKDGCPGFGTTERPQLCRYCYKGNTAQAPHNMSLDTFKRILNKLGPQLTQVAFGITGVKTNPDFISMMEYCREKGIVPNFTLTGADLDEDMAQRLGQVTGACAVSWHGDTELCFNTIERMTRAGVKQVNIHAVTVDKQGLLSLMTRIGIRRFMSQDFKLNAVVLLSLKPKGRAKNLKCITPEELNEVVELAKSLSINVGFDSCSAHKAFEMYPPEMHHMIEPCESGLFSIYVDSYATFHPCSFAEDTVTDVTIDMTQVTDFLKEVWFEPTVVAWRERLIAGERRCPLQF